MTDELTDIEGQVPVEHALAGGEPQRVGWFRFYFADERWEWSPQVERMHGYEPGTARPTTDLVLSHKHPDDYGQVAATLDEIRRTSGAFSTRHRIVDTRGDVHHVVVVGDQIFDDAGQVVGTHGFYVDVTPSIREAHDERVSEAVAEIAEARSGIEQAKGMLMGWSTGSMPTQRLSCSNGGPRRPTPSCGYSPGKSRRTFSTFPTTRRCPPVPSTTDCC